MMIPSGEQFVSHDVTFNCADRDQQTYPKVHFAGGKGDKDSDKGAFCNVSQGFGEKVSLCRVHSSFYPVSRCTRYVSQ